jgi:RNA polymerase sigma-70 factor (ECF subfamily)
MDAFRRSYLPLGITERVNTDSESGSARVRLLIPNASTRERAMNWKDGSTTRPSLLRRVADWADHPAWCDFRNSYDPLIRRWCAGYGLDGSTLADLCQQIWVELADRMRTYRYDPGKTFRGWLRKFCRSRAVDLLRKRRTEVVRVFGELPADSLALLLAVDTTGGDEHEDSESRRALLLREAQQVQHAVQQRVEPQTWRAFWQIAVDGRSVREAADEMGMSYAAVFAAHKRVARMLRALGQRRLTERYPEGPQSAAPDHS